MADGVDDLARRNYTALVRALRDTKQSRVAELLPDMSETKLSRLKSDGELEQFCAIAAACDLVLQPKTFRAVDPERLRALEVLARCALDAPTIQEDA